MMTMDSILVQHISSHAQEPIGLNSKNYLLQMELTMIFLVALFPSQPTTPLSEQIVMMITEPTQAPHISSTGQELPGVSRPS